MTIISYVIIEDFRYQIRSLKNSCQITMFTVIKVVESAQRYNVSRMCNDVMVHGISHTISSCNSMVYLSDLTIHVFREQMCICFHTNSSHFPSYGTSLSCTWFETSRSTLGGVEGQAY